MPFGGGVQAASGVAKEGIGADGGESPGSIEGDVILEGKERIEIEAKVPPAGRSRDEGTISERKGGVGTGASHGGIRAREVHQFQFGGLQKEAGASKEVRQDVEGEAEEGDIVECHYTPPTQLCPYIQGSRTSKASR